MKKLFTTIIGLLLTLSILVMPITIKADSHAIDNPEKAISANVISMNRYHNGEISEEYIYKYENGIHVQTEQYWYYEGKRILDAVQDVERDAKGNVTKNVLYQIDDKGNKHAYRADETTYDEAGNITSFTEYHLTETAGEGGTTIVNYEPSRKDTIEYDSQGRETAISYYQFDKVEKAGAPGEYEYVEKMYDKEEYIYEGNTETFNDYTKDYVNEGLFYIQNSTITTTTENEIVTIRLSQDWMAMDHSLINNSKEVETLENGKVVNSIYYEWDRDNEKWAECSKQEITEEQNENRKVFCIVNYNWDSDNEKWVDCAKQEITEEQIVNGTLITTNEYSYSDGSYKLIGEYLLKTTIIDNVEEVESIDYSIDDGNRSFIYAYKNVYKYDKYGNLLENYEYEKDDETKEYEGGLEYSFGYEYYRTYKLVVDGKVIKEEQVLDGTTITLPDAPTKKGYKFVGWDKNTTTITDDTVFTAIFEKKSNVGAIIGITLGSLLLLLLLLYIAMYIYWRKKAKALPILKASYKALDKIFGDPHKEEQTKEVEQKEETPVTEETEAPAQEESKTEE